VEARGERGAPPRRLLGPLFATAPPGSPGRRARWSLSRQAGQVAIGAALGRTSREVLAGLRGALPWMLAA
jgi:hypothetical protein